MALARAGSGLQYGRSGEIGSDIHFTSFAIAFAYFPRIAQFIVEEKECLGSADAFWNKFTDEETGNRLGYKAILGKLRLARAERDGQDAANARACFNGNLDHPAAQGRFRYSKGSKTRILERDDKIASVWRRTLAEDEEVAARWEQMGS